MSIRARIFAVIGVVVAAAFIQTLVVVSLEKQRAATRGELDSTLWRVENQAAVVRLITELESAQRGYLATGTPAFRDEYDRLWAIYERTVSLLPQYARDDRSRALFAELDRLVQDWHAKASLPLFQRRAQSADVAAGLVELAVPRQQRIRRLVDQLQIAQQNLLADQRVRSNDQFLRATLLTLTIPAFAIVMLLALVAILARILLDPLAAVAESARQISSGNFDVTLPRDSPDEIGALVRAFRNMTAAVQRRQRDLTDAVAREHEISQMYAELRAKAEQEQGRLLATISTVPVALILLDAASGRIVLQNKAAEDLIGREPVDEADRRGHWARFRVTYRDGTPCRPGDWGPSLALRGQLTMGQELIVWHPDGRMIPILVSAAPLRDDQGRITGAVAAFQDITNLHEVDRLKSEFVSIVSHELRTPLTSIKGAIQLLMSEVDLVDPDHRTLMDVALSNIDRLGRIINDILDISKIEAGKIELAPRPCAVGDLVQHSLQSVAQIARGASISLRSVVPAGVPHVVADPDRTVQAIVNLLSNALKYAPAGSEVTMDVSEQPGQVVAFAITDRGRGIPADKVDSLFQKFKQLDGSDSRKVRGTGLGLAITKALVEAQGGSVAVRSVVNEGSTFTITLPAAGM